MLYIILILFWPLLQIGLCGVSSDRYTKHYKKSYEGYKVYHVFPQNDEQIKYLEHLWLNDSSMKLDFWKPPNKNLRRVDVMVPPEFQKRFEKEMKDRSIVTSVMMENVGEAIEKEREIEKWSAAFMRDFVGRRRSSHHHGRGVSGFRLDRYHSYSEMQAWMLKLSQLYPGLVHFQSLPDNTARRPIKTHESRTIDLIKIGKNTGRRKPAFWIDGGIHAREWVAPSVVLYVMSQLLGGYYSNPKIRQYVDSIDWYLVPVLNPDGYEYSRTGDRMWRKNRNHNKDRRPWCWGVDLNRNFDWSWGGKGSSNGRCQETYRGEVAFSEPESKGVKNIFRQIRGQVEGYITFHSYAQLWTYPYGYEYNVRPFDWRELLRVAKEATKTLKSYHGRSFHVDTGANALYPAAGGSDDWAKGRMNIKYVYLVELRPQDKSGSSFANGAAGFILPASQLVPTGEETWGGIQVVADAILQRNNIQPVTKGRATRRRGVIKTGRRRD